MSFHQRSPIVGVPFFASSAPAAAMTTSFKTGFTAIPTRQPSIPPRGIVHIISPSAGELISKAVVREALGVTTFELVDREAANFLGVWRGLSARIPAVG